MKKTKKYALCLAAVIASLCAAVSAQTAIPKENVVPGKNAFTGDGNALNFENANASDYFRNTQWDNKELFTYDIAENSALDGYGKMLRITMDTEKYSAKYESSVYVYHTVQTDFEQAMTRPGLLVYDTYGSGTIGFWLNGSKHMGLGTLSKPAAVKHVTVNNSTVYPDKLSSLNIQYAVNGNCGNIQYIDNLAFIPYYKAEYCIEYPDGSTSDSIVKYFLCADGDVKTSADGTLSGLPTEYVPETIELSYPKYELAGWSDRKGAAEASDKIALKNEDIKLYPVWKQKNVLDEVTVKIWYDDAKTKGGEITVTEGDEIVFPSRADSAKYVPDGSFLLGFRMDGMLYSPGAKASVPGGSAEAEAAAEYMSLKSELYGDLVFYENFQSFAEKTDISSSAVPVSYINPSFSDNPSHFTICIGDYANKLYIDGDGGKNRALVIRQNTVSQTWPQFKIRNNGASPEGEYTLTAEFMIPLSQIGSISSPSVRFCGSSSNITKSKTVAQTEAGKYVSVSVTSSVGENFKDEAIKLYQIYATANSSSGDAYFYADSIALYRKSAKCEVKFDGADSTSSFYIPGDKIKLPLRSDVYTKIPDGFVLKGFEKDEKIYEPGAEYQTSANDSALVFTAVYEKSSYNLAFRLGSENGTIGETAVCDGQKAILPKDGFAGAQKLSGWRIAGTQETLAPGAEYTFEYSKAKSMLDGTSRLIFEAVYSGDENSAVGFDRNYVLSDGMFSGASEEELGYIRTAYEYGIIPAENVFDGKAKVSLSELLSAAERLYYRSRGEKSYFASDEARAQDMSEKGVLTVSGNLNDEADFAVLGTVLANVLPDESYAELCFNVKIKGIAPSEDGYAEALKLVRSGILSEDTDFSAKITRLDFVKAIAKLSAPKLRETKNHRRLFILGDSLTAETAGAGWPNRLELGGSFELVNYGIAGLDTRSYLSESHTANSLYRKMLGEIKPGDYVAIALGTNDSTLWERGSMTYNETRDNYYTYIKEIRAEGAIPFLVCPIGRNSVDDNGVYIESDPKIIECMNDVNGVYGADVPIIDFKSVSFERFKAMTAEERAKIYKDSVHYTEYGAQVAAEYFIELASKSKECAMLGLKNYFTANTPGFFGKENVFAFGVPSLGGDLSVCETLPSGIRFSASVGAPIRKISDDVSEYGFIVTRASLLDGKELTHKTDVEFVSGRAYGNITGEDIKRSESADGSEVLISAILTGFPDTKEAYIAELAVRCWARIGVSYFYGNTVRTSAYETAKSIEAPGEFAKHVIEVCGN